MAGNVGPVGDVAAISADQTTVTMEAAHGLDEGTLVRLRQGPKRLEGYVKPNGGADIQFQVCADRELKNPLKLGECSAEAKVDALNADDWAVVAGINIYPGLRNLQGPIFDAQTFKNWAVDSGYVPDGQVLPV